MKHNYWKLSPAHDWAGGCMGGNSIPWPHCTVATVKTLAPNFVNSTKWHVVFWIFCLLFVQCGELVRSCLSLLHSHTKAVYGCLLVFLLIYIHIYIYIYMYILKASAVFISLFTILCSFCY